MKEPILLSVVCFLVLFQRLFPMFPYIGKHLNGVVSRLALRLALKMENWTVIYKHESTNYIAKKIQHDKVVLYRRKKTRSTKKNRLEETKLVYACRVPLNQIEEAGITYAPNTQFVTFRNFGIWSFFCRSSVHFLVCFFTRNSTEYISAWVKTLYTCIRYPALVKRSKAFDSVHLVRTVELIRDRQIAYLKKHYRGHLAFGVMTILQWEYSMPDLAFFGVLGLRERYSNRLEELVALECLKLNTSGDYEYNPKAILFLLDCNNNLKTRETTTNAALVAALVSSVISLVIWFLT